MRAELCYLEQLRCERGTDLFASVGGDVRKEHGLLFIIVLCKIECACRSGFNNGLGSWACWKGLGLVCIAISRKSELEVSKVCVGRKYEVVLWEKGSYSC